MVRGATLSFGRFLRVAPDGFRPARARTNGRFRPARLRSRLVFAAALLLSGCGLFSERWQWNQKLTVEVLVDGKTVSSSAVSNVMWQEPNVLGNYETDYSGEATMVDLGERGLVFALIGEGTKYVAQYTLQDELGGAGANCSRRSCGSGARAKFRATDIRCLSPSPTSMTPRR